MFNLLVVLALLGQDDKAADEAIERFKKAYATNSEPERAAAVAEVTKVVHRKVLSKVSPVVISDPGPTVRIAAAKGLAGFTDLKKETSGLLTGALNPNSKYPDVQVAILEALGKLDDETTLRVIHGYFDDKDSKLARAALGAAGAIRHADSIPVILELLKKLEKFAKLKDDGTIDAGTVGGFNVPGGEDQNRKRAQEVLPAANKALQDITREKLTTAKDWQVWWNEKKATFKVEK